MFMELNSCFAILPTALKGVIVTASVEKEIAQILCDEKLMLVYLKQNRVAVCDSHRNPSTKVLSKCNENIYKNMIMLQKI